MPLALEDRRALNHQRAKSETPARQARLDPRECPERGGRKDLTVK